MTIDPGTTSRSAVPRRGAPRKGEPTARERILSVANQLFYQRGIRAIGVDTIIAESGVAKATFYRTFESKDALIGAYLAERDRLIWHWWDRTVNEYADDPAAALDALLTGMARQIRHTDFRGCPFLNSATEFPDPAHPGHRSAQANKDELRRRLTDLCARAGADDPDTAAVQLFLLINGAFASGAMTGDADLARSLVDAAHRLVGGGR